MGPRVRKGASRGAWLVIAAAALFTAPAPARAQQRSSLNGTWEIGVETKAGARPEAWREAKVPAPFEDALGSGFDGVAWYRCPLPLASSGPAGTRVRVEFAAVATAATVFCNGVEVGRHLGGWTPFRVELTQALHFDGNDLLEVRVDERVGHNTQGFLPEIQPHFGGIWQGVTLCVDRGPTIDRLGLFAFGKLADDGKGELALRVPWLAAGEAGSARVPAKVVVELRDGESLVSARELDWSGAALALKIVLSEVTPWSPVAPHLDTLKVELRGADGKLLDRLERRVGFRSLATRGTTVLWNGAPLQVRGLLHWGFSPPHLAPPSDREFWREQLVEAKARGFNTFKCCLWVPPSVVYDLCDELGLLVWQEYPTWHPQMDAAHRGELRAEYDEFFAHDGWHPSVAFRSLTCETGHGAELAVIQELFDACHAAVPDTLVVDDSSWIGWQRVTDFWDEHPYGNNRWLPGRLKEFAEHQAKAGEKPLLLGECIAADTWCDRAAWEREHGATPAWWAPTMLADQRRFEEWLTKEFGPDVVATLGPVSRDVALRTRKFQIERLRATLPDAGYVVSVARDFPSARMGLRDDLDQWKWSAADFAFQRDVALSLVTEGDARAFRGTARFPVVVSDFSAGAAGRNATLSLTLSGPPEIASAIRREITLVRGGVTQPVVLEATLPPGDDAERFSVLAELFDSSGASLARNEWPLWLLPSDDRPTRVRVRPSEPPSPEALEPVRVVDHLEPATLDFLEKGGRVLLRVAGAKRTLKSEEMWWLRGAPFAPAHPFHQRVPLALLLELQQFDLDSGRVMSWRGLESEVDPILAFWETHGLDVVRGHLFVFDTRVGKGRLAATCLDAATAAGRWVEAELVRHLEDGPAPKRALSAETLATLRGLLADQRVDLAGWRFRIDPDDKGLAAGFAKPANDASGWRTIRAGEHWEGQGEDLGRPLQHYDGVAWYRVDVDVPASFAGHAARAVFEGIDDSAIVWLDGAEVGRFGDPVTRKSVWQERSVAELGPLAPGRHVLVARVVDHAGAGGLWKPVYLTTGPAGDASTLLE